MDNQQTSLPEIEIFKQHPTYLELSISQYGKVVNAKTNRHVSYLLVFSGNIFGVSTILK